MKENIAKIYSINTLKLVLTSFLVQLRFEGLQFYKKGTPSQIFSYDICEVNRNIIFTEDSWVTTSDFQQHFGHITCSISNKST